MNRTVYLVLELCWISPVHGYCSPVHVQLADYTAITFFCPYELRTESAFLRTFSEAE